MPEPSEREVVLRIVERYFCISPGLRASLEAALNEVSEQLGRHNPAGFRACREAAIRARPRKLRPKDDYDNGYNEGTAEYRDIIDALEPTL